MTINKLTRNERRRLSRQGVVVEELLKREKEVAKNVTERAVRMYSLAMAMTLHDKWGFGEVRLKRYLADVQELFDNINNNYVDFKDIEEVLLKECKVNFKGEI